ncbi:HAD family hydrolase [Paenibacillus yonginensis]|uniref:HAD family hydrolase n=2 Tax=Paenibacillus yonginensis TaxID=1462996 RepID=A0A1B1N6K4_9BACL|nr:HAD family hydrolase [Paenibacillus yonginensis]ANS77025.1 HAD family hydrolase [Paenibacillus yonginensis]
MRQAIFLDVDDTLYDHLSPMREALEEELRLPASFPYERAYYLFRYYSDLLSDREGLSASPDRDKIANMQKQRFMLMLADLGVTIDERQAGRLQAAYLARQFAIRPFEGALQLIEGLKRKGHLVGLITNGAGPHQMRKIGALQMENHIPKQRIFVSGVVGMAKPDPDLFAHVNQVTGTLPEHSIYIGDSWRNDVAGSLGAGWTSIWFNHRHAEPESELTPHHVVSSYAEMSRILLGEQAGE